MAPLPENWVKKACAKKPKYGVLNMKLQAMTEPLETDGCLMASDGVRAHYHFDGAYEFISPAEEARATAIDNLFAEREKARAGYVIATFSPYAVRKACAASLTFFKKINRNDFAFPPFIYVFFGKSLMKVGTARDVIGSMEFRLREGDKWKLAKSARVQHYKLQSEGQHQVYFNPILLEQALAGMGDSVTMRFNAKNFSHHFASEEGGAEAVVMPLTPEPLVKLYKPVFKDFQYGYDFRADNKV